MINFMYIKANCVCVSIIKRTKKTKVHGSFSVVKVFRTYSNFPSQTKEMPMIPKRLSAQINSLQKKAGREDRK